MSSVTCVLSSASRLLLEKNANVDIQDSEGKTALHIALARGNGAFTRYDALMQVICKYWLLLFFLLFEFESVCLSQPHVIALHFLCNSLLSSTFRLLLEKNANVDIQDSEGKTALQYMAVAKADEEAEKCWLESHGKKERHEHSKVRAECPEGMYIVCWRVGFSGRGVMSLQGYYLHGDEKTPVAMKLLGIEGDSSEFLVNTEGFTSVEAR
jgi:Ankyrin repeats (many copies)